MPRYMAMAMPADMSLHISRYMAMNMVTHPHMPPTHRYTHVYTPVSSVPLVRQYMAVQHTSYQQLMGHKSYQQLMGHLSYQQLMGHLSYQQLMGHKSYQQLMDI